MIEKRTYPYCPNCGDPIAETLVGIIRGPNTNQYKCRSCGKTGLVCEIKEDFCQVCKHSFDLHSKDQLGKIRCSHVEEGVSEGLIVIPWTQKCDCTNYSSEIVRRRKIREAENQKRRDEFLEEVLRHIEGEKIENDR